MSETSRLIEQIRNKKKDAQIAIDHEFQELLAESEQSTKTALQQRQKILLNAIDQSNQIIFQAVESVQQQRLEQINQLNSSTQVRLTLTNKILGISTAILAVLALILFILIGKQASQIAANATVLKQQQIAIENNHFKRQQR